jgi:DNA-binding transcriptional regulator/RsmH inhibitor MraZ
MTNKLTLDKAGRVVIPKPLRNAAPATLSS